MRSFVFSLLAGSTLIVAPMAQAEDVSRIAILSAFDPEWQALTAQVHDARTERLAGNTVVIGTLGGKPVVLMLSGVSMVNAAMNTQRLIDHYHVRAIVFSGIAGGVDPSLHIGDVVVPEQWAQSLESVMARKTGDTYTPPPWLWGVSQHSGYGMIIPRGISAGNASTSPAMHETFAADPHLIDLARQVAANVHLKACTSARLCLDHVPQVIVGGEGVSSPAFVDNAEYRAYLSATFHARATDMESAAVVQVAYSNDVPVIVFRSLSDLAGGDAGANQMATFTTLASENSATVVEAFVAAMPER
jgi:adenosylhomocysteine nucleosidase